MPAQQIVPNERAANASPYRIQLSVRNLHSSGPDIFIEDVALMVDDVRSPPSPARAWVQPVGDANLLVNPFLATYQGQPVGFAISGRSQGVVPEGHVRLRPAELDQLTLTITSTTNVSLRFHVRIRYRLTNELEVRTIVPKDRFAAVFADDHLWQPYHLVDGRLLPA